MQGIDGIIRFQKERELDKEECIQLNESVNIIEELMEASGYNIPKESRPQLKKLTQNFFTEIKKIENITFTEPGEEDKVDAYNDIVVFALGAILKLGYNPKLTLKEVSKVINSRTGSMVDGKFEKDLSDEAKAKWVKQDYSTCKE